MLLFAFFVFYFCFYCFLWTRDAHTLSCTLAVQRVRLHVTFSCCRTFIVRQFFPALWWKGKPKEMRRAFRETKGVHMAQYTVPCERKTQRTEPPHPLCLLVSSHSTSDAKCPTSFLPPIFCVSITNQRHLVLGTPLLSRCDFRPFFTGCLCHLEGASP